MVGDGCGHSFLFTMTLNILCVLLSLDFEKSTKNALFMTSQIPLRKYKQIIINRFLIIRYFCWNKLWILFSVKILNITFKQSKILLLPYPHVIQIIRLHCSVVKGADWKYLKISRKFYSIRVQSLNNFTFPH